MTRDERIAQAQKAIDDMCDFGTGAVMVEPDGSIRHVPIGDAYITNKRDERIDEIKGRTYTEIDVVFETSNACIEQLRDAAYCPSKCGERLRRTWWGAQYQCSRKPGHGLGGLFCRQHAKNNPEIEE